MKLHKHLVNPNKIKRKRNRHVVARRIRNFHRRTKQPKRVRYVVVQNDSGRGPGGAHHTVPVLEVWMIKGGDVWDVSEDL